MKTGASAGRYWALFVLLSDLSGHTHELAHHVVARLVCGQWGEITFWKYAGPECGEGFRAYVGTFAGPLWSYTLAWLGALLIIRGRHALGMALVFSQFTWQRLLLGMFMNDEGWLRKALLPGATGFIVEAALLIILALPPLVIACRALRTDGALRLLGFYLAGAVVGWVSFLFWNALASDLPLGMSWGMSRWYLVVVPAEVFLVVLWGRRWDRYPVTKPSLA
jgi:hypothetical protein